ncbi:hypothetical protein Cgig2_004343 [Carnegiea gigantea]|uniref:Superoxide dismutase copper/zinc binding domain-containing protein n=1 Tax=Carnegiea gigantea TaxID=171969 RepID=A0A9Q1JJJ9_9CARY|nr:hypothetical protein Cgig2_004343 [Carnegiea gigantea]
MQAALAAMAAHTLLTLNPSQPTFSLLAPFPATPTSSISASPRSSSFHGPSFKLSPKFIFLSSATAPRPLTIVAATKKAVAVLKGNSNVEGVVTLTQEDDGPTTVKVRVNGLTPGKHGFHLYFVYLTGGVWMNFNSTNMETPQMGASQQCFPSYICVIFVGHFLLVGSHFNPNNMTHGAPEEEVRHAGDLGNIVANADGVAEAAIVDNQIPLSGPNSVVGRAFVVHELEDDLGKGGHELSLTTGNAGGRLACVMHLVLILNTDPVSGKLV